MNNNVDVLYFAYHKTHHDFRREFKGKGYIFYILSTCGSQDTGEFYAIFSRKEVHFVVCKILSGYACMHVTCVHIFIIYTF
jgi:hypothetical protein